VSWFLDTDTCIYALKGTYPAIANQVLRRSPNSIKVPAIVKAELLFGAEKSDQRERTLGAIESFLSPFDLVPFGDAAAERYARIRADLERRGEPIGPNDLIIAATVLAAAGTLVTHNTAEFRRVRGLDVVAWTV